MIKRRTWMTAAGAALLLFLSLAKVFAAPCPRRPGATCLASPQGLQSWLDPTNVSHSPVVDSEAPALIVTNSGCAHIVWEEGDELYHTYRTGDSWSAPSRVATGEQPSLAVAPDDTVHLVFVNEIGDVYNVYYTRWDGADWAQPPRKVSDTSPFSDSPQLAAADGHLHVVWTEDDQVYYGSSSDGLIWAYAAFADGSAPTIGVDGNGAVQAAWQGEEAADYDVYFSTLDGYSWLPPLNVSDSLGADSTAPDLFVQSDGTPHLAWQEVLSATPQIRYSHGPGWTQTVTLSDSSTGAYLPSLTIDAWGRPHAAWEEFAFPYYRIRHTSSPAEDPIWIAPTTLAQSSSLSQQLEEVSLYPGPDGAIHVVWVETEAGKGEIFYLRSQLYHIYLPLLVKPA